MAVTNTLVNCNIAAIMVVKKFVILVPDQSRTDETGLFTTTILRSKKITVVIYYKL
jgi:hypothetical protein